MAITETAEEPRRAVLRSRLDPEGHRPGTDRGLIVPIPGTHNPERVRENLAAASVTLTEDEVRDIGATPPARSASPEAAAPGAEAYG
jgi:hypothetical protein